MSFLVAGDTATFTLNNISKDSTVVLSGSTKAIEYTITYTVDSNKGTAAKTTEKFTVKDLPLTVDNAVTAKTGYKFTGWDTPVITETGDKTVTAQFEQVDVT